MRLQLKPCEIEKDGEEKKNTKDEEEKSPILVPSLQAKIMSTKIATVKSVPWEISSPDSNQWLLKRSYSDHPDRSTRFVPDNITAPSKLNDGLVNILVFIIQ